MSYPCWDVLTSVSVTAVWLTLDSVSICFHSICLGVMEFVEVSRTACSPSMIFFCTVTVQGPSVGCGQS